MRFYVFNAIVSMVALLFLGWLLLVHRAEPSADFSFLPAVNASLNATSAVLLAAGWLAIRARPQRRRLHQYLMVSAFAVSAVFLICYVVYHSFHGDTKYTGAYRPLYLSLLASHVLLSMTVVPLALSAFYFAWQKNFVTHRKFTRWLAPIWLYVSVTGVAIFFVLRGSY